MTKINKDDVIEYITINYEDGYESIKLELYNHYNIEGETPENYVIDYLISYHMEDNRLKNEMYERRKAQLSKLKKIELPEQRSPEWYEMRKDKLTASSLASAIGHDHFQSRDELLLSKIEDKPYEANPITEWGVKYEDVAIAFYEELNNIKILDFGMIPHPTFAAFGASPDGICDDTGNDEYVGRMVEIKCPPKRKFTKTVPPHYLMQVQGQLEVCDLDECDFFQMKIEEYENYDEYCKDRFVDDDTIVEGRTHLNYPKGATITYKNGDKLSYKYCHLNMSGDQLLKWIESHDKTNLFEVKWWFISRYECTLVRRNKSWWTESIDKILDFYNDLLFYRKEENIQELKDKVTESKKRKKKTVFKPLDEFMLVSDDEDN